MRLRVLVTGAGGLIGPHVCEALRALGHEVITIGRSEGCDISADILDAQSRRRAVRTAQASHLVHLAWHDDPRDRWFAPENLDWAAATIDLLRVFAEAGGQRALCAGSCAEYDWSQHALGSDGVLIEDSRLRPGSLYGEAKARTGELLTAAQKELGLTVSWARIFFCYGPDEAPGRLLSDLTQGILSNQRVPCTDGLQKRDFLYTPDLGNALAAVLLSDLTGPVNIGSGVATPVGELITTAAALLGRPDLIDLGARPRPEDDPPIICADVAKLRGIGWAPKYSLQDSLRDCFERQGLLTDPQSEVSGGM